MHYFLTNKATLLTRRKIYKNYLVLRQSKNTFFLLDSNVVQHFNTLEGAYETEAMANNQLQ